MRINLSKIIFLNILFLNIGFIFSTTEEFDTVVCAAFEEGFQKAYVQESAWWAIRLSQTAREKLKYLAIYEKSPVMAVKNIAEIEKIVIADKDQLADSWFTEEILAALGDVDIEWVDPSTNDDQTGIVAVHLSTPTGVVVLD
jgi:hypothetical protein